MRRDGALRHVHAGVRALRAGAVRVGEGRGHVQVVPRCDVRARRRAAHLLPHRCDVLLRDHVVQLASHEHSQAKRALPQPQRTGSNGSRREQQPA